LGVAADTLLIVAERMGLHFVRVQKRLLFCRFYLLVNGIDAVPGFGKADWLATAQPLNCVDSPALSILLP
jgi:hypothetical protein